MCWSASVSLFFAVFESLALVFICWTCFTFKKNYFKRNPTKKFINFSHNLQYERLLWSLPFAISINVVEWSEFFIWLGYESKAFATHYILFNLLFLGKVARSRINP